MAFFVNLMISILTIILSIFLIGIVHEIGHYVVARFIMKEENVKIVMGFFGKPILDSKRFTINTWFFAGAYVGNYSDGEAKKSHMMMLFSAGGFFMILMGIPLALYLTGGNISIGNLINFEGIIPFRPIREDLFSDPAILQAGFVVPWLSLTVQDFLNLFLLRMQNLNAFILVFVVVPYFYPLRGSGKWHWNPSDAMWVLKYAFNKVSEKDTANAMSLVGENTGEKQEDN